jgi:uncharacterized membrane protein YjjP (DUF1212 family)
MDTPDGLREQASGSLPSLEPIAMAALDAGRLLMEAGASAKSVEGIVELVAHGLGAESVDLRMGYASLSVTLAVGDSGISRMRKVGPLGVNQQLDQRLWDLAGLVSRRELTAEQTRAGLAQMALETPRHSRWLVAVGVGLACAAFGRLLGVDWFGSGPVFASAAVGQYIRGKLLQYRVNAFLRTALISFLSSMLGGLLASWAGSATLTTAVIASVLLLVPGVPAVNAQSDILEGYPTLGSARAVTVAMTLVFIAAGLWVSRVLLIYWHIA